MGADIKSLSGINSGTYFRELAHAMPDLILLVDPVNFQILFINHLPEGSKQEEIIGSSVFKILPAAHIEFYRILLNKIASSGLTQALDLETPGASNEKGKAWYSCSGSPVKNEAGETESILLISKDITDVKLHDIEIHNKEEKLYAILNNTNDVILSVDRDLKLTEYNTVFGSMIEKGFQKKNLNGSSIFDYIDPKKHDHLRGIYAKVFKGEIANDIESFETRTGMVVYNETSYHPIYNFDQEITGISIFSKNITERILSEQKLKNTLKEREVLLAEIHHRIKNNLALVSSVLQLKEMNIENTSAKEALSDSRKRIKSTALVHEMLYRNDTFDRVRLNEYLTELFNNLNMKSEIKLELQGDDPVFVLNQALPFGLMMHELMMNSFKHSFRETEQSKIRISSQRKKDELHIEYCDFGGTFPEEVNFMDTSSTGLMLIHTFIEQLGGSILLKSKTPPQYEIKIPLE
jgi:PAS domain S-box-containing protein